MFTHLPWCGGWSGFGNLMAAKRLKKHKSTGSILKFLRLFVATVLFNPL